jgi:hypothetical protein
MAKPDNTQINFSKTTDANGWTVYDYGNFKTYSKRLQFGTLTANSVTHLSTASTMPVGKNWSTIRFSMLISNDGGYVEQVKANLQVSGTNTAFDIWAANTGAGVTGNIAIDLIGLDV